MELNTGVKSAKMNIMSFLSNRPIWAFWLSYSLITGILFGVFYTAMYLLALKWWIPIVIILPVGIIWGSITYNNDLQDIER